jgi:hypothetical protein
MHTTTTVRSNRAALTAERYILLSGWQFDSEVALLRGAEAEAAAAPVTLLKLLDYLCEQKPGLQILDLGLGLRAGVRGRARVDAAPGVRLDTHERLRFRFDDNHVERGCHHQKFVVIDGQLSFLGGLDLLRGPLGRPQTRTTTTSCGMSRGEPHKPFHDIQADLRGREPARAARASCSVRAGCAPAATPSSCRRTDCSGERQRAATGDCATARAERVA